MTQETIQLKVSASTIPSKFAGSLARCLQEGKQVSAKALGNQALYRMAKGIVVAQGFVDQNELDHTSPRKLVTHFEIENYEGEGEEALIGFIAHFTLI